MTEDCSKCGKRCEDGDYNILEIYGETPLYTLCKKCKDDLKTWFATD